MIAKGYLQLEVKCTGLLLASNSAEFTIIQDDLTGKFFLKDLYHKVKEGRNYTLRLNGMLINKGKPEVIFQLFRESSLIAEKVEFIDNPD